MTMPARLRITEIFVSLQGETSFTGLPTVFIRLTGCPLRCQYCDTEYAFSGGDWMSLDEIVEQTQHYKVQHVTVTGGEPLAQRVPCLALIKQLCDAGLTVSIETSGAMPIQEVDPRAVIIMDIKTPDSKEQHRNLPDNIPLLRDTDEVKFVICSREDYEFAVQTCQQHDWFTKGKPAILFSPSYNDVEPRTLADWIVADRLPVRFQMQLHKILWHDEPGR